MGRTFAFDHDMVVNGVAQVDAIYTERGESSDEGAVEDVGKCEWRPVELVLWLSQTQKGEQGHE